MAKLPRIDPGGRWLRDLLHSGRREEALQRIEALIQAGKAGDETKKLAAYLASAGRGRQPFGGTHLWYEIGMDNEIMRDDGASYAERMAKLTGQYMLAQTQVETAIAKYERAMAEARATNDECPPG